MNKRFIEKSFGDKAGSYDGAAQLQKRVADTLANFLPDLSAPRVLEIGCGTGLFTKHLLAAYPKAELCITDISPEMLDVCRAKFEGLGNISFGILDGNALGEHDQKYDLIVSAMNLQWLSNPLQGLINMQACLKDDGGGQVLYSTIGAQTFQEWRASLQALNAPVGLLDVPQWPSEHIIKQELIEVDYGSAEGFLRALKAVGAGTPRAGYKSLDSSLMRKVCEHFDDNYHGRSSWDIVYGRCSCS